MLTRSFCGLPVSRAVPTFGAILLCLSTSACLSTPERPVAGPNPSDPNARAPATAYRPVLGGYVSQRPVEPAPWRQQNDRVAPAEKQ
jgi:hypothetical protein